MDLKAQYVKYRDEIDAAIQKVIDSAQFIMGGEISALESNLAAYTGSDHCVSASSGTDALLLALMAVGVKEGDEVVTTPFTFIATAEVIALLGAIPVFVDIDEETYNIDASKIEEKVSSKTKAVMPVSLYGQPPDMDEINAVAERHGLAVIEDACQSFGATYKGRKSCNLSRIGCTSFFPAKPLGCYGDGGAAFTNDDALAEKMRVVRNHGQTKRYVHKYIGLNARLDTIQAAILNVKLKYFDAEVKKRNLIADRYASLLSGEGHVRTPKVKDDRTSVYAQYSIRVRDREQVVSRLKDKGIPTAIHYPRPLHLQEAFGYLGLKKGDFPISENISREIMSIPMSAFLDEKDQEFIAGSLQSFV